ncbi:UNKNOWN [Stylonychia lemnae]|uniref:Uncharacterized protein n=1 Tax=Stylonychia lemnae TaxID=5949 RepID=A0A078AC18_STYLE|nr:UNKNOWN [Stylonychia lemnae]|eukprot:CDW79835.1 UNKNOWN [Stylonychia lemnae]
MLNLKQIIFISFFLFISVYSISIGNQAIIQKQFSQVPNLSREFKLLQIQDFLSDPNQQYASQNNEGSEEDNEELIGKNNLIKVFDETNKQILLILEQLPDYIRDENVSNEIKIQKNQENDMDYLESNPEKDLQFNNTIFENINDKVLNSSAMFDEQDSVIGTHNDASSDEIIEPISDLMEDAYQDRGNETDKVQIYENKTISTVNLQENWQELQELFEELHPESPILNQTVNLLNSNSSASEQLNATTNNKCNKTLECSQNYTQKLVLMVEAIEVNFQAANKQVEQAQANLELFQNQAKLIGHALEDIKQQLSCSHQEQNQSNIGQAEEISNPLNVSTSTANDLKEDMEQILEKTEEIQQSQEIQTQQQIPQHLEEQNEKIEDFDENGQESLDHSVSQSKQESENNEYLEYLQIPKELLAQTQFIQKRLQLLSQTQQSTF